MKYDNPYVTEFTPRLGNAFTRWFGSLALKLSGWTLVGQLPKEKKVVVIGAPHTSNWDFFIIMAAVLGVGLHFSWMMKKEGFFFPFKRLLKWMGGVPIDRSIKSDVTTQMADWFKEQDNVWLGLTPEGTRRKVKNFKKGYLRIAYAAQVPVFVVGLNAAKKQIVLDKLWPLTYDTEYDNRKIKEYFDQNFQGINPEKQ